MGKIINSGTPKLAASAVLVPGIVTHNWEALSCGNWFLRTISILMPSACKVSPTILPLMPPTAGWGSACKALTNLTGGIKGEISIWKRKSGFCSFISLAVCNKNGLKLVTSVTRLPGKKEIKLGSVLGNWLCLAK